MKLAIGIDIGGTYIKGVALDTNGNVLYKHTLPTNDSLDQEWKNIVAEVINIVHQNIDHDDFPIGISAPGIPNKESSAIAFMPGRLEGLENFEWSTFLKKKTYIVNDAVAALLAEQKLGAAQGYENVVMVTLGTGVGGAILINGKPYLGANNMAGHIGHMVIDSEGEADIVGMPGSLENVIGNFNIAQRSKGKFSSTAALLEAYVNNDPFAQTVWNTSVKKLAIGLSSIVNILSPDAIVIGGGITKAEGYLFDPLVEYMEQYEWKPSGNTTKIIKATYGEFAGAVGAACFAQLKN